MFKECLPKLLCTRTTCVFFHSEGNIRLSRQDLKSSSEGGKTESPYKFGILILIMLCPWALFGMMVFCYLGSISLSNWDQWERFGCFNIECCKNFTCIIGQSTLFSRKMLNCSALSRKFEIDILSWNCGGMQSIFLLLVVFFKPTWRIS